MAETINTAEMAVRLADDTFPTFYWEKVGPSDQNWACVKLDEHKRQASKTHPSDAVFRYRHPYTGKQTYIIFDYKSLADKSISVSAMGTATVQLGFALDCSMVSGGWQSLYLQDEDYDLQGGLFVYNHDNNYKRDISRQIYRNINSDFPKSWVKLQKQHEIWVIDPNTIVFLNSLCKDIKLLEQDKKVPVADYRGFYQPDKQIQYQKLAHSDHYRVPLLLDQLTSDTIIVRYDINELNNGHYESGKEGFIVYYRDTGENVDEFIYLIDTLFTYQVIDRAMKIEIRLMSPHQNAFPNLERAIHEYSLMVSSSDSIAEFIKDRLSVVEISSFDRIVPTYFTTELGMR